jgi:hypothetical protein
VLNVGCCTQMEAAPPIHIIAPIQASIHSIMRFMAKLLSTKGVRKLKGCYDFATAIPTIRSAAVRRLDSFSTLAESLASSSELNNNPFIPFAKKRGCPSFGTAREI